MLLQISFSFFHCKFNRLPMSILPQLFKGEGYCRGFIYAIVPDNVGVERGLNYIDYLRGNATDELVFKRLSQRYRSCSGRVFTACYISYKIFFPETPACNDLRI